MRFPIWNPGAGAALEFAIDPEFVTTSVPKTLWIELTSKCPFDCVFCTRRTRFGPGRNLDFEIYQRIIAELEEPDFIGLNYSGESIYYPRLLDAIRLAVSTSAATELVTAFSTISQPLLRGIVESGLDRLAISLHTMDPEQYQAIYRFGSLDLLKRRVAEFLELRSALRLQKPRLDFCFVAMAENLGQLGAVADYAKSLGIPEISVHPLIGRHPVPYDFSRELLGQQLRSGFKDALRDAVAELRARHSEFTVNVLNADLDPNPRLTRIPAYYAPELPPGARIHTCDQSPFETVHVLAGGDVVVCEVHDEVSLGNLAQQSLRAIWNSDLYREFRRKYVEAGIPQCRSCVWKQAHLPEPVQSSIDLSGGMNPQLLRGWHQYDGNGIAWSRKQAVAALANPRFGKSIRIAGTLTPGPAGSNNSLALLCNGLPLGTVQNDSSGYKSFEAAFPVQPKWDRLYVEFSVSHPYRPSLHSSSSDSRDLGVALRRMEVCR